MVIILYHTIPYHTVLIAASLSRTFVHYTFGLKRSSWSEKKKHWSNIIKLHNVRKQNREQKLSNSKRCNTNCIWLQTSRDQWGHWWLFGIFPKWAQLPISLFINTVSFCHWLLLDFGWILPFSIVGNVTVIDLLQTTPVLPQRRK